VSHRVWTLFVLATVALASVRPLEARAQAQTQDTSPVTEARKHFKRGVALYRESDYRGALVEFKRAYELAPNATVLYNIGQTHYQLQSYAAALAMLERYMAEAGTNAPHRPEVEQTLEILRSRVAKVRISTNVSGCEILVDDELAGKTPLAGPLTVSVGRRKFTAIYPGRSADIRFVEVAAGDVVPVSLSVGEQVSAARREQAPAHPSPGTNYARIGWITTGVLGAGAVTTGVFAYLAVRKLDDTRSSPTTRDDLDSRASRAKTLSLVADVLGAATIVAAAVSVKLTLSRARTHEVKVSVAPNGIQLTGVFH
jgi:tetratricopeptide (TPR) repeat protein